MKNKNTAEQKPQFSKSLGSGVKSMFGAGGRTYYVLEHRTHSQKHKAGDVNEIIVDYIEIGRDKKCQVRFGDDMPTVSRRHAAISKEGSKWTIKQLSTVNQTIVNGRPVSNQWFLENGDELQLSADGPKIGFIVPQNNTTGSLGLSKRLSLFRQQALRPYKTAITVLSIFFLVALAGGSVAIYNAMKQTRIAGEIIEELKQFQEISQMEADSLRQQIAENEGMRKQMEERMNQMQGTISRISRQQSENASQTYSSEVSNADFSMLYPGVYQIIFEKFTIVYEGETASEDINSPIGSGFLLIDGRFITARHVIEPWYFASDDETELLYINALEQMGARVTARFKAVSPSGNSFSFTNHDMYVDRSADKTMTYTDEDGDRYLVKISDTDRLDWARKNTTLSGGLLFDSNLSTQLPQRTQLEVLGYPLGMAARTVGGISPIYGGCTVASDGLQNGIILISARNFEHGNSGGPVFAQKDGRHYVVGIISGGAGDNIGFIVPISAIR